MSRNRQRKLRVPALVHHKPTGRARIRINGRDIYCGLWGDDDKPPPEADAKYRRIITEWLKSGNVPQAGEGECSADASPQPLSINELIPSTTV